MEKAGNVNQERLIISEIFKKDIYHYKILWQPKKEGEEYLI
jgi:uncharacterized membrane protein